MRWLGAVLGGLAILFTPPGEVAADASVSIRGNDFLPGRVTVAAGETVTWVHDDGRSGHNISLPGVFRSPGMYEGATFSHTFNEPGTYSYGCSLHPTLMTGLVVVLGQAAPTASAAPSPPVAGSTPGAPGRSSAPPTPTATLPPAATATPPPTATPVSTPTPAGETATPAIPVLPPAAGPGAVHEETGAGKVVPVAAAGTVALAAALAWLVRRKRAR